MFNVFMVCHLWDLLEEGVDATLDRVQGELGLTGITVPVVCPPMTLLRCRPDPAPRVFRTRGGVFFPPQENCYAATRCKPVPSTWIKGRNPLAKAAETCRKRDLAFRVSICTSLAGRIIDRHPEAAAKTAHGDAFADRLCLVNPDVQALIVGLCNDLAANYDPEAIELTEFHTGRIAPGSLGYDEPFDLGPGGRSLLALCFCESCRQLGGDGQTSPDAAVRSAQVRLTQIMDTGRSLALSPADLLAEDPAIRAHADRQWHALANLAKTAATEAERDIIVRHCENTIVTRNGVHPLAPNGGHNCVMPLAYWLRQPDDTAIARVAETALRQAAPGWRYELVMGAGPGPLAADTPGSAPALVRALSTAADAGVTHVTLESYGQLPGASLTAVKQAIRFARRTSAKR